MLVVAIRGYYYQRKQSW